MAERFLNYIGGQWLPSRSGKTFQNLNPATGELLGEFPASNAEDVNAAVDSLVACKFAFFGASLEEYAELLTAITGTAYSPQRLKEIGRRIVLTERFYNCANGFARSDDILPERFFSEAGSSGDGIDIHPIDRVRFEEELDKYYRIRGLNGNGRFDDGAFLEKQP